MSKANHQAMSINRRRRRLLQGAALAAAWPMLGIGSPAASPLLHRSIPGTGEAIPAIGLDTTQGFSLAAQGADPRSVAEVLSLLGNLPNCLVDTSPLEAGMQSLIGSTASRLQLGEGLFMSVNILAHGRAEAVLQLQDAQRSLRRDRLDLVQVQNLVDWQTHLPLLREWKEQGRVRYIGVRHYHHAAFGAIERIMLEHPLDFVQINYSLAETEAEQTLLPLARELGVAVIAARPFSGAYLLRKVRNMRLPAWAGTFGCKTWPQFFLKYILAHPAVTCTTPGSSTPAQLASNLKASLGRLPDATERGRMRRLIQAV